MRNLLSESLKKMVQTEPTFTAGKRNARVIAVSAQKGGVGKTTTTVNLAAALAAGHDHRVLIVDVDAQGHVGASLGSPPAAQRQRSLKCSSLQPALTFWKRLWKPTWPMCT